MERLFLLYGFCRSMEWRAIQRWHRRLRSDDSSPNTVGFSGQKAHGMKSLIAVASLTLLSALAVTPSVQSSG
jgi:hypothetical protein